MNHMVDEKLEDVKLVSTNEGNMDDVVTEYDDSTDDYLVQSMVALFRNELQQITTGLREELIVSIRDEIRESLHVALRDEMIESLRDDLVVATKEEFSKTLAGDIRHVIATELATAVKKQMQPMLVDMKRDMITIIRNEIQESIKLDLDDIRTDLCKSMSGLRVNTRSTTPPRTSQRRNTQIEDGVS